jgi:hypothetical protein
MEGKVQVNFAIPVSWKERMEEIASEIAKDKRKIDGRPYSYIDLIKEVLNERFTLSG